MKTLAIIVMLGLVPPAWADAPGEVTADQAIALYREHSPRLAAARGAVDVTAADLVDARIYPNPTIGIMAGDTAHDVNSTSVTQEQLDLEIPILIGGQRHRREQAAGAHVAAKRAEVVADQAAAEGEIRSKVVALLAAQQRTVTLVAALEDTRAVRAIVALRASAGAKSAYEVERIDLAMAALASKLDDARADEQTESSVLASMVGIAGWHPRAAGQLQPAATAAPMAVDPDHPALAVGRADQVAAKADEARARADAVPTPSLQVSAATTTGPVGFAVTAGFSIPLPVFDRNQGAIARSRAEQRRVELEHVARTAELTAGLERASGLLAIRRETLTRFQADALARVGKIRTMAEASYKAGQGGIVELLDALDAITEARMREIELLAAVADAEIAVRLAALGR